MKRRTTVVKPAIKRAAIPILRQLADNFFSALGSGSASLKILYLQVGHHSRSAAILLLQYGHFGFAIVVSSKTACPAWDKPFTGGLTAPDEVKTWAWVPARETN